LGVDSGSYEIYETARNLDNKIREDCSKYFEVKT